MRFAAVIFLPVPAASLAGRRRASGPFERRSSAFPLRLSGGQGKHGPILTEAAARESGVHVQEIGQAGTFLCPPESAVVGARPSQVSRVGRASAASFIRVASRLAGASS